MRGIGGEGMKVICEVNEIDKTLTHGCPNCKEIIVSGCGTYADDAMVLSGKYELCHNCGIELQWQI